MVCGWVGRWVGDLLLSLSVQNNPGTDEAALLITYYPPIGSKVVPSLLLSPRVEK